MLAKLNDDCKPAILSRLIANRPHDMQRISLVICDEVLEIVVYAGQRLVAGVFDGPSEISAEMRGYYAVECSARLKRVVSPAEIVTVRIKTQGRSHDTPVKEFSTTKEEAEKFVANFKKLRQPFL